jgi:hypothetical protein
MGTRMSRLSLLLLTLLGIAVVIIIINRGSMSNLQDDFRSSQDLHELSIKEVKYWRDKEGKSHARATVAESNLEVAKTVLGDELQSLSREVSGLKKNLKNLESYITVGITTSGSVIAPLRDTVLVRDSVTFTAKSFTWGDKWMQIDGMLADNTAHITYQSRDSLTFVTYYKKNGLLKTPSLMLDAISHNPNSTITGIKNVKITNIKRRRPRLGFYAGYGIGRGGFSPQVGVGLVY